MATTRPSVGLADLPFRKPYAVMRGDALCAQEAPETWTETRAVDIALRGPDGTPVHAHLGTPAHPVFDAAFSAFGRGTLIATPRGEVAIEDLSPGDDVLTGQGDARAVLWIGTCTFRPAADGTRMPLVRIMSDSFGVGRPNGYLTLGPGARLLQTPARLRGQIGGTRLLTQACAFVDGDGVVAMVPQTPVPLYHLMLDRHATIRASGLDCETFHPGLTAARALPRSLRQRFLALFPQIADIEDFGPLACPRAPDLDPEFAPETRPEPAPGAVW